MNKNWLIIGGVVILIFIAPWTIYLLPFVIIIWLVLKGLKFLTNGYSLNERIRPYTEVPDAENVVFTIQNDMTNPWLQKITANRMYGKVPDNIIKLMDRVSADKKEKVIGSIWTWHGWLEQGYLIITTRYLRWVRVFPSANEDEFFGLGEPMDKYGDDGLTTPAIVGTVLTVAGLQFQIKFNADNAREFKKLYGIVQQTLLHYNAEEDRPPEYNENSPAKNVSSAGIAEELGKLADLHQKKIITDEEFKSAKQQLLSKG